MSNETQPKPVATVERHVTLHQAALRLSDLERTIDGLIAKVTNSAMDEPAIKTDSPEPSLFGVLDDTPNFLNEFNANMDRKLTELKSILYG